VPRRNWWFVNFTEKMGLTLPNRKRSKFIADLLKKQFQKQKEQALIKAYKDAYTEIKTENQEFEGTINDGIS
jgi:hypothetical protein